METIKSNLGQMGWLANGITIVVFLVPIVLFFFRMANSRKKRIRSFSELLKKRERRTDSSELIKMFSTIAIVDDEPVDFPIEELESAGYRVKNFERVQLADVPEISKFDLVFLDIYGVVKDDIQNGGLLLIEQLRQLNPAQKICAVSRKTYDPTASNFFRQADHVKKKPITARECLDVINDLLKDDFDLEVLSARLDQAFQSLGSSARYRWLGRYVENLARKGRLPSPPPLPSELQNDKGLEAAVRNFAKVYRHEAG